MACMRMAPWLASSTLEGACTDQISFFSSMPSRIGVHLKMPSSTLGKRFTIGMTIGRELVLLE